MKVILIVFSVLVIGAGVLMTSQATSGVAIIGIACWFGIMARIAQADEHQEETRKLLIWMKGE